MNKIQIKRRWTGGLVERGQGSNMKELTYENICRCLEDAGVAISDSGEDCDPWFEGMPNRPPKRWFVTVDSDLDLLDHLKILTDTIWPVFGRGIVVFDGTVPDKGGSQFMLRPALEGEG